MKRPLPRIPLSVMILVGLGVSAQEGPATLARQELLDQRWELGLDADHDFRVRGVHHDELGQTHTRFQQTFKGLKVWGGDLITHKDAHGQRRSHSGELTGSFHLYTQPVLSGKEALAIADADLAPKGGYAYEPTTELVVYPVLSDIVKPGKASLREDHRSATDYQRQVVKHVLAYHVHTQLENGAEETRHTDYLVDANTGAILKKWSTLRDSAAVGSGKSQYSGTVSLNTNLNGSSYELSDVVGSMAIKTYNLNHKTSGTGTLYTDADNAWGDGANYVSGSSTTSANGQTAAVDAHFGIQATSAFYYNVVGRNGIDGAGKATYSRVHYSKSYDNAFWDDTCFCMTYGDGSDFTSLEALDVAGHEMSHGVCAATANLDYSGESGGLNEANSDIFGTLVTFYTYGASGSGTTIPDGIASANLHGYTPWTIGSQLSSTPLRYMYKPSKDGYSPDAWSSTLKNLDVHYSSGPMNRAAYFLSQGATTSGDTSTSYLPSGMTGIGNDKTARIWYRALTTYLTSSSDYAGARAAAISAAKDLYGAGSAEEQAVWNAFHGINVGDAWGTSAVTVKITPSAATVQAGGSATFTASVSGASSTAVAWSVVESGGGSITSAGLYTAPATAGTYHVKATSKADSAVSATATVTVTAAGSSDLITNGSFENGATGWSGTTSSIGVWSGQPAADGTADAWLMGNGKTVTETLYQAVTIPSSVSSATLSFYLHIDTAETTTSKAYDKLVVSLQSTSGSTLKTLATYSNLNKGTGYTLKNFDVSAYKGKTLRVYFKGSEDSSLQTSFVIDKVALVTK
ncbi:MAG TPA: M4 family metallopeptidase [Holophaga sp.]|nr:M4 family metallopeptidase [Holophaga sp.]